MEDGPVSADAVIPEDVPAVGHGRPQESLRLRGPGSDEGPRFGDSFRDLREAVLVAGVALFLLLPGRQQAGGARCQGVETGATDRAAGRGERFAISGPTGAVGEAVGEHQPDPAVEGQVVPLLPGFVGPPREHLESARGVAVEVIVVGLERGFDTGVAVALADVALDRPHPGHLPQVGERRHPRRPGGCATRVDGRDQRFQVWPFSFFALVDFEIGGAAGADVVPFFSLVEMLDRFVERAERLSSATLSSVSILR